MVRLITYITLMVLFLPSWTTAQISIRATVDTTGMLIGDQLQLKLQIQHPKNAQVQSFYASALDTIQDLEVIDESLWDTSGTDPITIEKNITFSIFDSGYYFIPRIPHAMFLNGDTSIYFSNDIPISVSTVAANDSTTLAPIRTIKEEPLTLEDVLPYLGGLLAIGGLFGLMYWISKRPKKEDIAEIVPEEIIPAHLIALEKLNALKEKELWQKGEQKEYHSELTYIVREYLENRYHISALESTTYEILEELKNVDFDARFKNNLTKMLSISDLVKFAKAESSEEINKRIIVEVEEFISTTKIEDETI
ncbi:MAG: hypothetical protein HKN09_02325 [Saprospiraceae bacterium]|nr:hypothetical protein [Saprospiraceae bacterium]